MNTQHLSRLDIVAIIWSLPLMMEPPLLVQANSTIPYFIAFDALLFLLYAYMIFRSLKGKEYAKAIAYLNMEVLLCFIAYFAVQAAPQA